MNHSSRTIKSSVVTSVIAVALAAGWVFPVPGSAATQLAKLTASDGTAADLFGISVAVSGDTAVVGSPHGRAGVIPATGSAHVFTRTGGVWTEQAKLTASDAGPGDRFGWSVSISGDTIVVSAFWDDIGLNPDQGSVYVFTRTGETWTEQAKLTASDGAAFDEFGYSAAVSGDTVVVGAPKDDVAPNTDAKPVENQGSVHIFGRTGTTWTKQAQLTASEGAAGDLFGFSVGVSGVTAVIGALLDDVAPKEDVARNKDQGSAYVFARTDGAWGEQAHLTASNGAGGDQFGFWVSVSGDTAVVGANLHNSQQGAAYVFRRFGQTWPEEADLVASDGAAGDYFGRSVAVSGDMVVVGAQFDDVDPHADQGSAYVFTRADGTWPQKAHLIAPDGNDNDLFGVSVGASGDTAILGASFSDIGVKRFQGSAYIWQDSAPPTMWVEIDVKPGDETNRIRTSGTESIAVAVLTTATFDATTVDPSSVCFGDEPPAGGTTSYNQPAGVDADCNEEHHRGHLEDADGDGDLDMVFHFESAQTGIDPGDTVARLTGRTTSGQLIEGTDSIQTTR